MVTDAIPRHIKILYYTDNNASMHGKKYMGKSVISPEFLNEHKFDCLILASQFYKEIELGLSIGSKECNYQIEYFNKYVVLDKTCSIKYRIAQYLFEVLSSYESSLIVHLLSKLYLDNGHVVKKIQWLDEQNDNIAQVFDEERIFLSHAPHYVGTYQKTCSVELPPARLYHFKNGIIDTASRTIEINDNLIIERGLKNGYEQGDFTGGRLARHGKKLAVVKGFTKQTIEKAVLINSVSDTNYYHCIMEMYCQLFYLNKLDPKFDDYPIAIPQKILSIQSLNDCFRSLDINRKTIFLDSNKSTLIKNLLVITTPNNNLAINLKYGQTDAGQNYLREETVDYIRSNALKYLLENPIQTNYSKRIYIGRKGPIRSFNQKEVINLLLNYGFECYYTETLSFAEQVSLFNNADFIVGPTGAAWTNLIFAQNGAKALCWHPINTGDLACFSNLAKIYNVDMEYLTYSTKGKLTRELFWEPYKISLAQIKYWLDSKLKP